jgi:hypothetical protein
LDGLRRNPPIQWSRATGEDNALSWENNISRMKNHWQWFSTLQLLEFKPGDKIKASAKDGELVFAKKQVVKL